MECLNIIVLTVGVSCSVGRSVSRPEMAIDELIPRLTNAYVPDRNSETIITC